MKLSEQLRRDREKLDSLDSRQKKLEFIWDYYKVPILLILAVVFVTIVTILNTQRNSKVSMYVVLLNNDSSVVECDDGIFDRIMTDAGYDMTGKRVDVNTSLSIGLEHNEQADIETRQILTALFAISDLDVYVADKENFDYFVENDGYANLGVLLQQDLQERYRNDLYICTDTSGKQIVAGIILHEDSLLHQAGFYHNDVIIGIVNNAVNFDEALAFVSTLLRK